MIRKNFPYLNCCLEGSEELCEEEVDGTDGERSDGIVTVDEFEGTTDGETIAEVSPDEETCDPSAEADDSP